MAGEYQKNLLRKQKKELRKLKRFLFPSVRYFLLSFVLMAVCLSIDFLHPPYFLFVLQAILVIVYSTTETLPILYKPIWGYAFFCSILLAIQIYTSFILPFNDMTLLLSILTTVYSIANTLPQLYRTCRFFSVCKDPTVISTLLKDFRNASSITHESFELLTLCLYQREKHLLLGQNYIFGWQGAVPIRYDDIQRIYEYHHWSDGYKSIRLLPRSRIYVTTHTNEEFLGVVPSAYLNFIISEILKKNPSIQYCTMKSSPFKHRVQYIPKDIDPNAYQSLFTQRSRKQ